MASTGSTVLDQLSIFCPSCLCFLVFISDCCILRFVNSESESSEQSRDGAPSQYWQLATLFEEGGISYCQVNDCSYHPIPLGFRSLESGLEALPAETPLTVSQRPRSVIPQKVMWGPNAMKMGCIRNRLLPHRSEIVPNSARASGLICRRRLVSGHHIAGQKLDCTLPLGRGGGRKVAFGADFAFLQGCQLGSVRRIKRERPV